MVLGDHENRPSVRGNLLGALGMLVAIVATLVHQDVISYGLIILGLIIGAGLGAWLALTVQMTAMPQMELVRSISSTVADRGRRWAEPWRLGQVIPSGS